MEPTSQEIEELRTQFFHKLDEENKDFHPKDIARATADDEWLKRFLIHHDLDMKDALNMLLETCEWRKLNKVNEINEQNINMNYLSEGSLFVHNRDRDGKSLFIFKCKKHVKGQKDFEELKKCVIYWFERVERQDRGDQITIFFDMMDTGLANMDMEYTKYIINLCKCYYPHFVNYILIFEMPWVLNAAFKIIKSWLPSKAVQKIKFVTKVTVKDFIDNHQALRCWGGLDDYEFSFQSELDGENVKVEDNKKKVHFADGSPITDGPSSFGDSRQDEYFSHKVKISPQEVIVFRAEGIELVGSLNITNASDMVITYKVKTTSPEKFRVKPSCGLLMPGASTHINVVLQSGYTGVSILRDKFLIMTFPVEHENYSTTELNDMWKNTDYKFDKVEHRLRCTVPSLHGPALNGSPGSVVLPQNSSLPPPPDLEQKMSQLLITVNHLSECNAKLHNELKLTQHLSWLIVVLVGVFGISLIYLLNSADPHCHPRSHFDP